MPGSSLCLGCQVVPSGLLAAPCWSAPPASPWRRTLKMPCCPFRLASHPWLKVCLPSAFESSSDGGVQQSNEFPSLSLVCTTQLSYPPIGPFSLFGKLSFTSLRLLVASLRFFRVAQTCNDCTHSTRCTSTRCTTLLTENLCSLYNGARAPIKVLHSRLIVCQSTVHHI